MKIINIMLGKQRGGLEQVAIDYHHALASNGHSVKTILRRGAMIALHPDMEHDYINLSYWPDLTHRRLIKQIDEFNADVVILHGNRPMKYLGQQKSFPVPRIYVAHNYRAKKHILNADAVFAVSAPVRDHFVSIGYPKSRTFIVHNTTNIPPITPMVFDPAQPVYGTFARLHKVKGIDLFIHALGELKRQGHNFKARIAGDGPERKSLEKLAADLNLTSHVEFTGWVDDKTAYFQSINILAAPSRCEAFGITLIEAMAAGIPLITTDLPGPRSILTNGDDALIVPKNNPTALATAMLDLSTNSDLREHMIKCQKSKTANFTTTAIADKLSEFVTAVTNQSHINT